MKLQHASKLLKHGIPIKRRMWRRNLWLSNIGESMHLQQVELTESKPYADSRPVITSKTSDNWMPSIGDLTASDWTFKLPVGVKVRWFK